MGEGKCIEDTETTFTVLFPTTNKAVKFAKDPYTVRKFIHAIDESVQSKILTESLLGYETFTYEGQLYCRKPGAPWKDLHLYTVPDSLQSEINVKIKKEQEAASIREEEERRRRELAELKSLSIVELLDRANNISQQINESFRRKQSNGKMRPANLANREEQELAQKAIPLYEIAFEKIMETPELHSPDIEVLRSNLPSLSARYRNVDKPELCITNLFDFYRLKCPKALGHEFFTSLSAAYCDLSDVEGALDYLEIALKLNRYRITYQMDNVITRIKYLISVRKEDEATEDSVTIPKALELVWQKNNPESR